MPLSSLQIVAGVAVVHVAAQRLTYESLPELRTALDRAALRGCGRVVLNLERTDYVDGSAFATLTVALKANLAAGGDLKLAGLRTPVAIVLELMRLYYVFDVYADAAEAAGAFTADAAAEEGEDTGQPRLANAA